MGYIVHQFELGKRTLPTRVHHFAGFADAANYDATSCKAMGCMTYKNEKSHQGDAPDGF